MEVLVRKGKQVAQVVLQAEYNLQQARNFVLDVRRGGLHSDHKQSVQHVIQESQQRGIQMILLQILNEPHKVHVLIALKEDILLAQRRNRNVQSVLRDTNQVIQKVKLFVQNVQQESQQQPKLLLIPS
jgi:hypothetical protein